MVQCFPHITLRRRRILVLTPPAATWEQSSDWAWLPLACSVAAVRSFWRPTLWCNHRLYCLSLPATAPFCHPSPATVLLLSLPAPACLHRSHQYLVVASSNRSIVCPPLHCLPLTFAIACRAIVNSFIFDRHLPLLPIASCCHFALGSSHRLPLLFPSMVLVVASLVPLPWLLPYPPFPPASLLC